MTRVEDGERRWRDYRTATGRSPFAQFMAGLPREEQAVVVAAMAVTAKKGVTAGRAKRLDKQIWEVKARGKRASYRVLFAEEGGRGQVLLALAGFTKKSQKTPRPTIELAKQRLSEWRRRGMGHGGPDRSLGR